MKWCESIGVSTVYDFKHLVIFVELLLGVTQDFEDFVLIATVDFGPVIHFDFFDVLFALSLGR